MDNIFILLKVTLVTGLLVLIPGYLLFLALFPRDNRYDPIQILGISGILGLSTNLLLGTLQTQIPNGIGLNLPVHLGVLAIFCCGCGLVYFFRNRSLSLDKKKIQRIFPEFKELISPRLFPAVAIVSLFVIGTIVFVNLYPRSPENSYTEFYVLDGSNSIPFHPSPDAIDGEIRLRVGVVNRENEQVNYKVQFESQGERLSNPVQFSLQNGEEWEVNVSLSSSRLKDISQLDILLYKENAALPYRRLRLDLTSDLAPLPVKFRDAGRIPRLPAVRG
jgi:uncharacterized membrane protein